MSDSQTRIRDMTADDLDAVLPLLDHLGYAMAREELERRFAAAAAAPGHLLLVAERRGAVIGFLHAFARPALEKPPEVVVQSMAVDREARRGGAGRALMARTEAWAAERGFASVALNSQEERGGAHAFYASLGYVRVATSGLLRKEIGG